MHAVLSKNIVKYAWWALLPGLCGPVCAEESRILSLKGMSLGLSELVVHRLFPELQCVDADSDLRVCTLEGKGVKELNVAGFEANHYRFDFAHDSLTALQIHLTNTAFDKVIEIFTQKYLAPSQVDNQVVENLYMQFDNRIITWKGGCNTALVVEKYTTNSETMSLTLKQVTAGEAEKPASDKANKAKSRAKR